MNSLNGCSGPCCGQYWDHSSYSRRPIRKAPVDCMPLAMVAPIFSSKYGKCHLSGDSTTPSSEMKKLETIFPIGASVLVVGSVVLKTDRPAGNHRCDRDARSSRYSRTISQMMARSSAASNGSSTEPVRVAR